MLTRKSASGSSADSRASAGCLTIGGQQWYIGHLNATKHEAYKSKVIAATVKAEQAAIATTKIANIGEQRVTVYRDRIKTIEASTNVQIDPVRA